MSIDMSIAIEQLRYIRLGTRDLDVAARFAERELGLQAVASSADEVAFRSDERQYTLVYAKGAPAQQAIGLEVRDIAALEAAIEALRAHGVAATRDDATAVRRNARALAAFDTPGGLHVELLVRPQNQAWRFFPQRDAGVTGLAAVAIRSTAIAADEALWTQVFGARIGDWAGDSVYLGFDAAHHRLALHPAPRPGVLAVEFEVDGINAVMRQFHRLREEAQTIMHGPGRRPTSEQVFVSFSGPDEVLYGFVAEGRSLAQEERHRPRQFAQQPASYCSWGSECRIAEFQDQAQGAPARAVLREVTRS
ncbi:MAG TPA: VOC family protein [Rhizomicrobium sp.]